MKIVDLGIPDIHIEFVDEFKVKFADEIISVILPYISKNVASKVVQLKKMRKIIKKKKSNVEILKRNIENLKKILDRKRKIKLLLDRASKLVALKALDDDGVKREIIVMLGMIEDLPPAKIDYFINEMMKIVMNKFSKVETFVEE